MKFCSVESYSDQFGETGPDPGLIRRERKVLLYARDRPLCDLSDCIICRQRGKRSLLTQDIVRLTVTAADTPGQPVSGTFSLEANGCRQGHLIADPGQLGDIADRSDITVDARHATAEECAEWLQGSADPERIAFGYMLTQALTTSADVGRNLEKSEGARLAAETARQTAEDLRRDAHDERLAATVGKRRGLAFAFAGFVMGGLMDIGMLEDKFGFALPPWGVAALGGSAGLIAFMAIFLIRERRRPEAAGGG